MTTTYTDSERLEFLVAQGYDCAAISQHPNYRAVIDRSIDSWSQRMADITTGKVRPTKETPAPRRFADAVNPQGFHPLKSSDFPEGSTTRAVLEIQEKDRAGK